MSSLNILIVEDELITANDIQETLEKAGHVVTAVARNIHIARLAVQQQLPDVALIDIDLGPGNANGIDVAQVIQAYGPIPIIYLTAHYEDATFLQAKETGPAAYLLKPFRHRELALQVELAYYHHQVNHKGKTHPAAAPELYLPVKKGYQRIDKADIVYIQANGAYTNIFLTTGKSPHILSMNLGYLAQFIPSPNFYRLSRSTLINVQHLERIEGNLLFLNHYSTPLTIPEASRKDLLAKLPVVRTP